MRDTVRFGLCAAPLALVAIHGIAQPRLTFTFAPGRKHSKMPSAKNKYARLVKSRRDVGRRRVWCENDSCAGDEVYQSF